MFVLNSTVAFVSLRYFKAERGNHSVMSVTGCSRSKGNQISFIPYKPRITGMPASALCWGTWHFLWILVWRCGRAATKPAEEHRGLAPVISWPGGSDCLSGESGPAWAFVEQPGDLQPSHSGHKNPQSGVLLVLKSRNESSFMKVIPFCSHYQRIKISKTTQSLDFRKGLLTCHWLLIR